MKLFTKILDYLFPRRCIFCNTPIYTDTGYCEDCVDLIPFTENVCPTCGKRPCVCEENNFCFSAVVSVFNYTLGAKNAISRLKFHEAVGYAKPLAEYLYQKLRQCKFYSCLDLLLPVPMTKKAVHQRGYNQSVLLAQELSKLCSIPMADKILIKKKETKKQHDLDKKERQNNLKDAFSVSVPADIVGKRILLLDDVYTTGATFQECAKVLLSAGAKEIFCIAVASTQLHLKESGISNTEPEERSPD